MNFATLLKSFLGMVGVVTLCVLLVTIPEVSGKSARKLKYCKLDMLMECGSETNAFVTSQQNGSGIVNSQEEMEQFCFNQVDYVPICVNQWLSRCANPVYTEIINKMVVNQLGPIFYGFCDLKGPIRNEFLKYSNCLIHKVKQSKYYRKVCIRGLQSASEFIHETTKNMSVPDLMYYRRNTCCSFNLWEACILGELEKHCGKPSAPVFAYLIKQGSMHMLKQLCSTDMFDPHNPSQCTKSEFIAPEGFMPKGLHSESLLSYIFSYACPNVGWGIVPERDF